MAARRAAARPIRAAGEQLNEAVHSLSGHVLGAGNPWGGDEPGTLFGMAYVEVSEHALDVYASMVDQLVEIADGVQVMAETYERTERFNTDLFKDR